jgi:hypothetical protein
VALDRDKGIHFERKFNVPVVVDDTLAFYCASNLACNRLLGAKFANGGVSTTVRAGNEAAGPVAPDNQARA